MKADQGIKIRSRKGFGLLISLLLITLLAGFASSSFRRAQNQVFLVGSQAQHYQALTLAKAGVNLARAGLLLDKNESDDLEEDWALLSQASQLAPIPLGNGFVSVQIIDEERKQNINAMTEPQLKEFFRTLGLKRVRKGDILDLDIIDENIHEELAEALLDWIDYDDVRRPNGAEGRDYRDEEFKYIPHNQPIATLGELLWVKGFSPEMLFGRKGNPRLLDMITIYGGGKINVNTASKEVLISFISQQDEYMAESTAQYLIDSRPFKGVGAAQNILNSYVGGGELSKKISIKSEYFRIIATGIVGKVESVVEAVVKRSGGKCDILLWKERQKRTQLSEEVEEDGSGSGS